jgi:hypothetical protein
MRLDADEDEIHGSAVGSTRIDRHARDFNVAYQVRRDAQPACAQRLEVGTARDEVDVMARTSQ